MRRGDIVTIALQGDLGKPRPALVVQSNFFAEHPSVTILPITSAEVQAPLLRIPVEPSPGNRLQRRSQIMVDKPQSVARAKVGPVIGRLEDELLVQVDRAMSVFLGLV